MGVCPLWNTYRALLDSPAEATSNLLHAVARDAVNHGLGVRHNNGHLVTIDQGTDETASAELIHLLVVHAVQVKSDVVALIPRLIRPPQNGSVVAAHLGVSGTVGRGPVKVVQDHAAHGVHAVVDASGHDEDAKHVLLGRVQAELGARAVNLGADVHGGAGLVGWDELGVERDGGAAGGDKHVLGDGRHGRHGGRVLHAHRVLVGAEDLDGGVGRGAEGLEALVGLLAVVEGGRHAVDPDKGVAHKLEGRPLARLLGPVRLDMAVDYASGQGCVVSPRSRRRMGEGGGPAQQPYTYLRESGSQHSPSRCWRWRGEGKQPLREGRVVSRLLCE